MRFSISVALYFFCVIGLGGCGGGKSTPIARPQTSAPHWVAGYYVAYERDMLPPDKIDWNGLTHIIMSRVLANADGTLNINFDWDATSGPLLAQDISAKAHAAGKKAILMLGGSDNGVEIKDAVTNHRASFVANLVNAMNSYGYDGLDLDWENNIDLDLFILFVQDLRAAAPNAILTIPGGPLNSNTDTVDPKTVTLANLADQYNLMSYYPATSWTGSGWFSWFSSPLDGMKPTTPVSIRNSFETYVAAGVSKEKLGMGVGFYTICYTGGITGPSQDTNNGVSIQGGDHVYPLSALYGLNGIYDESARHWDATAQNAYLSLAQPESHGCQYVPYEDEESLIAKGKFARDNGYGGVILWTMNQGYVPSHSQPNFLFEALRRGFIDPTLQPVVGISILEGDSWLAPNGTLQFHALVTGASSRAVTWNVPAGCGTITSGGLYTAPASETSCTLTATSQEDTGKIASVQLTISSATWDPFTNISLNRMGTHWLEITPQDATVSSMSFDADGGTQALTLNYIQSGTNYPVFATNYAFPLAATQYTVHARSKNNRLATTVLNIPACNPDANGLCQ
ncbi:MAG: glycoside hydrolase family 18 protein [Sideroxydans sp.]|nr:glycoside hydrolase family 18 protein [Sideroxydans sp.]